MRPTVENSLLAISQEQEVISSTSMLTKDQRLESYAIGSLRNADDNNTNQ